MKPSDAHSTPVTPTLGLCAFERRTTADSASAPSAGVGRLAYISRTSIASLLLARQQREELAPQRRVLQERAAHDAVDHRRVGVLHAAPVHAEVVGLHDDREAVGA